MNGPKVVSTPARSSKPMLQANAAPPLIPPAPDHHVACCRSSLKLRAPAWCPTGAPYVRNPTIVLLHGGPGFDHSIYKPSLASLAPQESCGDVRSSYVLLAVWHRSGYPA